MKVALLTNLIPPYHKPVYDLLAAHQELRIFLSTAMESNRPWQADWDGLDVVVQKGLTLKRRWRHPQFAEARAIHFPLDTMAQLRRFQPDAVISAEMGWRTLLACGYARRRNGCRLLIWSEVTARTEQGRGAARPILRRFLAKRADGFLAVGAEGVQYVESLGVKRERIFQIAYSTKLQPFLAIALERKASGARRLLFSGQLVERKGLTPFIETLNRWASAHGDIVVEFTLAGGGPLQQELAALPMEGNVKLLFTGNVSYAELPIIYAEAEIFVLPTLADTWGVAVNEALASGLPVLGSAYSQAVATMVEDGKTGWIFRPDEREEVYAALERAMSASASGLQAMREQARGRAQQFTPEHLAAVCERALQQT